MTSKKLNVFDLMDEDDEEKINKLLEENKLEKFKSSVFNEQFIEDVECDLSYLQDIELLWKDINEDPKIDKLIDIDHHLAVVFSFATLFSVIILFFD